MNTYGPNLDDRELYPKIQDMMAMNLGTPMLWAGDFNCIVDGEADRNPSKMGTKPAMTRTLLRATQNLGMCDIWRMR